MTTPLPEQPKPANPEAAEDATIISLTPLRKTNGAKASGVTVTSIPKPPKRKNAKERAKEKIKAKPAEDGTTPVMTATAKSKADLKKADTKTKRRKAKAGKAA
jgi:hypothetical protein